MSNGVAVLHAFEPTPSVTSSKDASIDPKPAAAIGPTEIETTIGAAVASAPDAVSAETMIEIGDLIARAAVLTCLALEKYLAGQATYSISLQTGELIARLYFLQQSAPGVFATIVRREGRRALRATLMQDAAAAAALVAEHGDLDPALDEILSWPLDVLARVTEAERAFAN
jgi:hypothetical protein